MRKYLFLVVAVFLSLILIPNSFAADAPQEMSNLSMKCISGTNIGTSKSQHFVKLDGTGFEPNKPLEIWRNSEEGFVCAIDSKGVSLCGSSAVSAGDNGKNFQILNMTKDQILTDGNGEIHLAKVRSRTKARLTHEFYGAQRIAVAVTNTDIPEMTAQEYGLKLLTFLKEQTVSSPSGSNNCATVFFDPYGRVFDSISLEPIPNVEVRLLDSNQTSVPNRPGVINPNLTSTDGAFSFFVDPGTYYLKPTAKNYTFPVTETELASLNTSQTIYTDLYRGEPIVQLEEIQHRDIPMSPLDPNNPTNTPPEITDQEILSVVENGKSYQKIFGSVSHPNSKIYVYSGSRLVGTTIADQAGAFEILIDNALVDQTQSLDIIAEKTSLETTPITRNQLIKWLNGFIPEAKAESLNQSKKVSLSPRPTFLIGFIYDQSHKLSPLTTVEVVIPKMHDTVYTTLKTDSNGFLFIPYQSLPPVEYVLRIKKANQGPEDQTTTEFIQNNQSFLNEEKVNLMAPQTEHVASVAASIKQSGLNFTQKYQPSASPTKTNTKTEGTNNQTSFLALLTIVTLLGIGGLIFALTRFKNSYKAKSTS